MIWANIYFKLGPINEYLLEDLDEKNASYERCKVFVSILEKIFPIKGRVRFRRTREKYCYVGIFREYDEHTKYEIYLYNGLFKINDDMNTNYNNRLDLFMNICHEYRHIYISQQGNNACEIVKPQESNYDYFKDEFEIDAMVFSLIFMEMWFGQDINYDQIPNKYRKSYRNRENRIKMDIYNSIYIFLEYGGVPWFIHKNKKLIVKFVEANRERLLIWK